MASCSEYLNSLGNPQCLLQFLSFLPDDVRQILNDALDVLSKIAEAEAFLSLNLDKYVQILIELIDEQIAAVLLLLQPLFNVLTVLTNIILPFATCAAAAEMISGIVAPIAEIQAAITSAAYRKQKLLEGIEAGSSKIMNAIFNQIQGSTFLGGVIKDLDEIKEIWDSLQNCIGAVGSLQIPPGPDPEALLQQILDAAQG